jgi:hypothetical protein
MRRKAVEFPDASAACQQIDALSETALDLWESGNRLPEMVGLLAVSVQRSGVVV